MKMNWKIGLVLVLLSLSQAQKLQDLKDRLLFKYDASTKPDGVVTITIKVKPTNIDLDPVSESMILTTWNTYSWIDPRLTWDATKENGIQDLKFEANQVWRPDVVPYSKQVPTQFLDEYQALVYSNGMVLMVPEETNQIFCPINAEQWPYGTQNCTYKMGSWHYSQKDVDIVGTADQFDPEDFFTSQFAIEGLSVTKSASKYACCSELYPYLSISVIFRRLKLWTTPQNAYNLTHIPQSQKLRFVRTSGATSSPKSYVLWFFLSILLVFGQ